MPDSHLLFPCPLPRTRFRPQLSHGLMTLEASFNGSPALSLSFSPSCFYPTAKVNFPQFSLIVLLLGPRVFPFVLFCLEFTCNFHSKTQTLGLTLLLFLSFLPFPDVSPLETYGAPHSGYKWTVIVSLSAFPYFSANSNLLPRSQRTLPCPPPLDWITCSSFESSCTLDILLRELILKFSPLRAGPKEGSSFFFEFSAIPVLTKKERKN